MCVSESKECLPLGKIGVLCFLITSVLRFALLSYYRRLSEIRINTYSLKYLYLEIVFKRKLLISLTRILLCFWKIGKWLGVEKTNDNFIKRSIQIWVCHHFSLFPHSFSFIVSIHLHYFSSKVAFGFSFNFCLL